MDGSPDGSHNSFKISLYSSVFPAAVPKNLTVFFRSTPHKVPSILAFFPELLLDRKSMNITEETK